MTGGRAPLLLDGQRRRPPGRTALRHSRSASPRSRPGAASRAASRRGSARAEARPPEVAEAKAESVQRTWARKRWKGSAAGLAARVTATKAKWAWPRRPGGCAFPTPLPTSTAPRGSAGTPSLGAGGGAGRAGSPGAPGAAGKGRRALGGSGPAGGGGRSAAVGRAARPPASGPARARARPRPAPPRGPRASGRDASRAEPSGAPPAGAAVAAWYLPDGPARDPRRTEDDDRRPTDPGLRTPSGCGGGCGRRGGGGGGGPRGPPSVLWTCSTPPKAAGLLEPAHLPLKDLRHFAV